MARQSAVPAAATVRLLCEGDTPLHWQTTINGDTEMSISLYHLIATLRARLV